MQLPSGVEATGQLDLFAWRPTPRKPVQLSLFGDLPDGAEEDAGRLAPARPRRPFLSRFGASSPIIPG